MTMMLMMLVVVIFVITIRPITFPPHPTNRDVRVAVDYIYSGEGRVPGVNDILNLDSDLVYFGGEVTKPNEEVRQGFVGCLKDVEFDSVPLSVHSSTGVGKLQKMRAVETGCIEEYFVKG